MLRSIGFISCGFEEVVALFVLEEVADLSDGLPELVAGSGCGFSDQGFELGERYLDSLAGRRLHAIAVRRVEVGGIWRQEQEPRADIFQDGGGLGAAVRGEVVQYHDVPLVQGRGQLGFDLEVEEFAVDRAADDPRRVQPVVAQRSNEGLGLPVTEGGMIESYS